MQQPTLTDRFSFALRVLESLERDSSFDAICDQLDLELQQLSQDLKQSDIILLMKYISYFKLQNKENVPHYFKENAKRPINQKLVIFIEDNLKRTITKKEIETGQTNTAGVHLAKEFMPKIKNEELNSFKANKVAKMAPLPLTALAELSDTELETIFCETRKLNFSVRLNSALDYLAIVWLGQVLLPENQEALGLVEGVVIRNVGRQTINELTEFLTSNNLEKIRLVEWPTIDEINLSIKKRKLKVGQKFALTSDGSGTLENEVVSILSQIVATGHQDGIFKRFGLKDDCIPWTLQEVGNEGFENGKQITRERVRQIQKKYLERLNNTVFSAEKCKRLSSYLEKQIIISKPILEKYVAEQELSKSSNATSLILRLKKFGFCTISHVLVEVTWINGQFLVREDYVETFHKILKILKQNLVGKVFVNINKTYVNLISEQEQNIFVESLKQLPNLFVYEESGTVFVAKRAYRLSRWGAGRDGLRTNSLVSTLALIFCICQAVNFSILEKSIARSRITKEDITPDLLKAYLKTLPFLKVEGDEVRCIKRPKSFGKYTRDLLLKDLAVELNSTTFTSKQMGQYLVSKGQSSNSAGVLGVTSPLIVNLRKGHGQQSGLFRLICNVDEIDMVAQKTDDGHSADNEDQTTKFTIKNNPPLRATGRASVAELDIVNGEYQLYDSEENFITDLTVKGKIILGLKSIAGQDNEKDLVLAFHEDRVILR